MSKGSKVVSVRFPDHDLTDMDVAIVSANLRRFDAPYNRSSFILSAVREKLDHLSRSRRPRERRTKATTKKKPPAPTK